MEIFLNWTFLLSDNFGLCQGDVRPASTDGMLKGKVRTIKGPEENPQLKYGYLQGKSLW